MLDATPYKKKMKKWLSNVIAGCLTKFIHKGITFKTLKLYNSLTPALLLPLPLASTSCPSLQTLAPTLDSVQVASQPFALLLGPLNETDADSKNTYVTDFLEGYFDSTR